MAYAKGEKQKAMKLFEFEKIARTMEKKFGKIAKGDEESHAMVLFPMEENLLKLNRKYPASNSRRLREAIFITLHQIDSYLTGKKADTGNFENEDNIRLKNALLYVFDPFSNEEVKDILTEKSELDLEDSEQMESYFQEPIQCILRILDSVDHWEKRSGSNGYFEFIESWIGEKVPRDDKLNFAILISGEKAPALMKEFVDGTEL